MRRQRTKSSQEDSNVDLPEGLSELLIHEVANLPQTSRKAEYLQKEYLKKYVSSETDPADLRRSRAVEKWLEQELVNEVTTERLISTDPEFQILPGVQMSDFLEFARRVVTDLIGDTVPEAALIGGFSGGASTSRDRASGHPSLKYLGQAHVTHDAYQHIESVKDLVPGWAKYWDEGLEIVLVPGNVMFTVPKTTLIDRCACKEPDINMFLQKGAGRVIRNALRGIGINLNDQSRNQRLARKGSIDGRLATVDLSSASDSVTTEFVFQVLPVAWFTHLDSIRSKITTLDDGEEHVNEMFSSMGNGFTFELESLLFYTLARSTAYFTGTRGVISVYGDDIIVPSSMFQSFEFVLSYFGFRVNPDKSFWEGDFRESCGGHFINGHDITPFYVREPIAKLSDLIKFANNLRSWSEVTGTGICDPEYYDLWKFCSEFIHERFWGGHEDGSRYQLKSPHRPKSRLMPMRKRWSTGTGGLLHWLNATDSRSVDSEIDNTEMSEASKEAEMMTVRRAARNSTVGPIPLFPQELG